MPAKDQSSLENDDQILMEKLKVAIVAASPRWLGGHSVQASLLVANWRDDPAATACFIPIDPEMPNLLSWVQRFPVIRTLVRTPFYLVALWRGMGNADIVHIFSASYLSFLLSPMPAWIIAHLRSKKTLIHYHSGEARDHLRRSCTAVRVLGAADCIVVPSCYLVDVFRGFKLRAQIVPNIIDSAQFSYRPRQPLRPRLLCTRGFHPYYSIDVVVRAFGLVKKEYPESRLCLVGGGPLQNEIEQLVKELGLANVEFVGPISHREIGPYYDRNDIFINASWLDNMPVSILEAFASGTPVVTTAPEGIRYLVEHEHTGLLCDPGEWKVLAENVIRLLREPDLAVRLARNAWEQSQSYRWVAVREQWLEVYRSLVDAPLSGGKYRKPSPSSSSAIINAGKLARKGRKVRSSHLRQFREFRELAYEKCLDRYNPVG